MSLPLVYLEETIRLNKLETADQLMNYLKAKGIAKCELVINTRNNKCDTFTKIEKMSKSSADSNVKKNRSRTAYA
jgi:hypothetical protein